MTIPFPVGSSIVPPVQVASRGPVKDVLLGVAPEDIVPPTNVRDPDPAQDPAPVPNPEPGTLILGGMGLAIMAAARRRMKQKQGE
ncbi:MAG: PEP-CTERM sorting domain-containing protein [Acidobacteriota bacterium]